MDEVAVFLEAQGLFGVVCPEVLDLSALVGAVEVEALLDDDAVQQHLYTQYLTKFGTDTAPQPQMNAAAGVPER